MSSAEEEIVINTPKERRHSITIVGLPKEYKKEEVINMLIMQNGFIKKFAVSNTIEDHIKIYAIRPLKNNPECFQAFANVSTKLREGFRQFKDKVTLGLIIRYNIKRCYNCQKRGHYIKYRFTRGVYISALCSENHFRCPSLLKHQNLLKSKESNFNLTYRNVLPQR